jgi:hypothetical protein
MLTTEHTPLDLRAWTSLRTKLVLKGILRTTKITLQHLKAAVRGGKQWAGSLQVTKWHLEVKHLPEVVEQPPEVVEQPPEVMEQPLEHEEAQEGEELQEVEGPLEVKELLEVEEPLEVEEAQEVVEKEAWA